MIRDTRPLEVSETKETLSAVIDKLSGKDGRQWRNIINILFQGLNPWDIKNWREPWMTITWGIYDRKELKKAGTTEPFTMDRYASKILKSITVVDFNKKARLMAVPVEILGFRRQVVSIEEICQKLAEIGCKPLTNEMVYNLHYQYINRHDKSVYIFSEDILNKDKENIEFRTHFILGPENGISKKLEAFGVKPNVASNFNLKYDDIIICVEM